MIAIATLTGMKAQDLGFWVGGRTSLWSGDSKTSFTLAPEAGFEITPQLTIAASLALETSHFDNSDFEDDYVGVILNPYMRYTFFKTGIVSGFVDGGLEVGLGDLDGLQIGFKPGIALSMSRRFTAVLHFGFVGYNDGEGIAGRSEGIGFDLSGYRSSVGIYYSF